HLLNSAIPLFWNALQFVSLKFRGAEFPDAPILFLRLGIKILSLFFLGSSFFLSCSFLFSNGFFLRTFLIKQIFRLLQSYFIGFRSFRQFYFCFTFYLIETPPTRFFNPYFFIGPFVY